MRSGKLAEDVDKLLTKECVLHKSRFFRLQNLWGVVDEHFVPQRMRNTIVGVSEKNKYDVYLQRGNQILLQPSDLYNWLGYFNIDANRRAAFKLQQRQYERDLQQQTVHNNMLLRKYDIDSRNAQRQDRSPPPMPQLDERVLKQLGMPDWLIGSHSPEGDSPDGDRHDDDMHDDDNEDTSVPETQEDSAYIGPHQQAYNVRYG